MSRVLAAIRRHAHAKPASIALRGGPAPLSYGELHAWITALADEFRFLGAGTVALLADNSPAWALVDLAALAAGLRVVPLPPFFSLAQVRHAVATAGVDTVIADPRMQIGTVCPARRTAPLRSLPAGLSLECLSLGHRAATPAGIPAGTQKITFTSGSTGEPKGVCLSVEAMEQVAQSLVDASQAQAGDVHLCTLPLSTLLENIGGLYAPLLVGASTCLRTLAEVGLVGATRIDGNTLRHALGAARATSTILVPQTLRALVDAIGTDAPAPESLRFVAVGGAPLAPALLERARALGVPVFEGYGLSECASVVALSTPEAQRPGTVGRPLPHLQLSFAADGEILVRGASFLGYTGDAACAPTAALATGDLGHLDADGFLVLTGRKKNLFVTAFGRNVAPEWVERELCDEPAIAQAAVFGEARAWNTAVIVAHAPDAEVHLAIQRVNARLPDYARVKHWVRAASPFSTDNAQLTANGRLRREPIFVAYGDAIDLLYREPINA